METIEDLRAQLAITQTLWIITAAVMLLLIIFLMLFVHFRDKKKNKIASEQAARLSAMTARVEAMINNLPGVVYQNVFTLPYFTCTFVSEGCLELTGYTAEEIMHDPNFKFLDIVHPDDVEYLINHGSDTLAKGLPAEVTYRIIARDGTEKWIWERSRVVERNPDGSPHLMEGYYTDITERRRLQAAELASQAKSDFLAVMSHEIRTPMNSILGFAELAGDLAIVPKTKEYLKKIMENAKWLLNIINDILDISKIESGKMELDSSPFDLRDIILRCQSVIMPNIIEKGIELNLHAEPITSKKLVGDPIRLHQVLLNLLSNAVKFTETGSVTLTAKQTDSAEGGCTVYFEVSDSGIGMTSEQTERIFESFVQADSGITRNYGGTGLGLAIAKNIVDLMGGNLSVRSTPGAGSAFSFEITFETIEDDADDMSTHLISGVIEKPQFKGLVLVCDDNPMNQEVIREHLIRVGLHTEEAENGEIAVNMVSNRINEGKEPFDLIFMDMFMPVMDGLEAASRITMMDTGTPIVAMTANIMVEELENYRKHGMPDCLGKPFTSQQLWRILLKYLTPV